MMALFTRGLEDCDPVDWKDLKLPLSENLVKDWEPLGLTFGFCSSSAGTSIVTNP